MLGNVNAAAAALRNWVLNLNKELSGTGVYAGHVAISVWIGNEGPEGIPSAEPDQMPPSTGNCTKPATAPSTSSPVDRRRGTCARSTGDRRLGKTLSTYRSQMRLHVLPALGSWRMSAIQPEHLEAHHRRKQTDGHSAHTIRAVHRVLRSALNESDSLAAVFPRLALVPHVERMDRDMGSGESSVHLAQGSAADGCQVDAACRGCNSMNGQILRMRW